MCLSCIKTKYGKTVPRPYWYMAYATRPFEYIHMDFIEMPLAANGMEHILVITDDYSLTTVLHACPTPDTEAVVTALLQDYLPYYPDPDLMHSDGGSHFDNEVIKKLAAARGWMRTQSAPYASWSNGVAEWNNKTMVNIMRRLCRKLNVEQNQWPSLLGLVQGAMNRHRRPSRANMSPIELTTGIRPRTTASTLRRHGKIVDVIAKPRLSLYRRQHANSRGVWKRYTTWRTSQGGRSQK